MRRFTSGLMLVLCLLCFSHISAQTGSKQINDYFEQHLENDLLETQDVQWIVTNEHVSRVSGIHHIYFKQVVNGIPVYGTESGIHLRPDGTVLSASDRFISNTSTRAAGSRSPSLTAVQAVQAAAAQLNYNSAGNFAILERKSNATQQTRLSGGGISSSDIPVELTYQLNENDELVLAWDLSIESSEVETEWYSARVDASTGQIIDKINWVVSCNFDHDHSTHDKEVLDFNANLFDIPNYDELVANAEAGCTECYQAFEMPIESPYYGNFSNVVQPAHPTASPFGWHDTDGAPGAEFTVTRGNNANAYEDGNNPGYQPDGGASLDFTGYPFSQIYSGANQYEDAAITNLFYWSNIIHDVVYIYGFDEVSGNFQENNYGNGGLGSDSVDSEAQDGSGTCNANMATPSDGSNPRMQMYVCGDKDGDFDNLVIVHEYAHGISNRLTGGPGASGCLGNQEQMGEGWSDWYGAVMTIEPGDQGGDARAVGTYLFGQGPGGNGIRPFPYSTDMAVNPQTYDDIKTVSVPHGVGSVWSTMLWEMTWELINEYGYDPDIYNFTGDVNQDAGNVQALAIVTEALKIQPCSPGFVDGRDAVLAADAAIYNGANECRIWNAFAKRGLGVSADQGSSNSRSDGTEAFDTPSGLAAFTAPADVCASEEVLTGLGGGTPFGGVYSGPGVTDDGNGATYSFDPAVAGVGVHSITYTVQAGTCSVASSASDSIEVLAVPNGPTTTGASDICVGEPVTVTATPSDPANVIRWFDAENGGNFLFEGTDYTFNPTSNTTVWAQENPPGPLSQLVISEITLETPDRFEITNVGVGTDYSGYTVAVSEEPYTNINTINSVQQTLGFIGQDGVVDFNDDGGAGYWGDNIWWNNDGNGWIIIIDTNGNVVDSVFWNFSAAEIAQLNVTINGFNITANDLDWTGDGASLLAECNGSFTRTGDTDSAADWSGVCNTTATYGVYNDNLGLGFTGCLASRTETQVTVDAVDPNVTCPPNMSETVNQGELFTIPDYTPMATATDNCNSSPTLTQDPAAGTQVGAGVTVITVSATDGAGNTGICTFELEVVEILSNIDNQLAGAIQLYPNPAQSELNLVNNSQERLSSVRITDVNGRVVQTAELNNSGTITTLSVENLSTGMYFVQIEAESATVVKRIVKQ
ncbi:M36 family metallopeptidase [Aureitalea sp. L0-47]|uniref:M36 family metallopeptidase n=1 Tax=Aureitalea sp. L0-47 TaxID=2816962 RepID=UPI0022370E0D|nr:M36 family metallopeptidase [Aureitalea sp. L0-47]MCW5519765.1 M36 family metallopeptidase [Aureitalea sp. L0-47]